MNEYLTETALKARRRYLREWRKANADKWGTGADRKARLTAAGYDYQAVQKAVNELLKKSAETPKAESKQTIATTVSMNGKTYSGTLTEE